MHLEATCDLRDGEQLNLVAVPIAEQLEDSLSDEIHEHQVEPGTTALSSAELIWSTW
jgi:hypothetical protein